MGESNICGVDSRRGTAMARKQKVAGKIYEDRTSGGRVNRQERGRHFGEGSLVTGLQATGH